MATSTSVRKHLPVSLRHASARAWVCFILLLLVAGGLIFDRTPLASTHSAPPDRRMLEAYGRLPLRFEANTGQTDARVKFLARGSRTTLFLTAAEAVLQLRGHAPGNDAPRADVLRLKLANANRAPVVVGLDELPGRHHYFTGRDAQRWRTNVATFGKVKYEAVYPGIDLVYYGKEQQLEYDFVVAAGADPRRIRMAFAGARTVRVNEKGELVLRLADGEVRQQPPLVYQETTAGRQVIPARYRLYANGQVGFTVGAYDRRQTLWIDPVLEYSTFLGGDRADQGLAIAVDAAGNAYVAGVSDSTDFPGPGPIQAVKGAASDAFIAKINPRGTALVYAAYLGGNSTDVASALALDAAGNIYLAGTTFSTDFPVTTGAVQRAATGFQDSFLAKLDSSGSALVYSTMLGGAGTDTLLGVAADAAGNAYFTGRTDSTEFAGLTNARQGNPLLKSIDRGQSWNGASAGLSATVVNGVTVDPTNPSRLYAATNYGVFKSTDGGANWRRTGTTGFAYTVAVDPVTPTTIYVGTSFSALKSIDGGDTYQSIFFDSTFGFPAIFSLLIDPTTPATLYAGTARGPFKSVNGGLSWAPIFNGMAQAPNAGPRVNRLVFDPTNPQTIYAATAFSNFGTLFKTTNGGALWTPANSGLGTSLNAEVFALAIDPTAPLTLYAGVGSFAGALFKTTDGGATWRQSSNGISYQFGGNTFLLSVNNIAVDPANPQTLYAGATTGGLFQSTDGGANWSVSRNGLTNQVITALTVDRAGTVYAGANSGGDAFLGKLNADGSALTYLRYFGGSENDEGRGIAVDASGNAYVIGTTLSSNLPTTNPFQTNNRGFADYVPTTDVFVAKLNAAGTDFIYATYLGGNSNDQGRAIALDAAGNVYLTGNAASTDFPLVNPFKPIKSDFGFDAFVAKLNAAGTALDYSTYLGGSSEDLAAALAVDAAGNAYVTGTTFSPDFPVVNTLQAPTALASNRRDLFISRLNPRGELLTFSTFFGGTNDEIVAGIAVDAARNVYLTGATISTDFPTLNPLRPAVGFSTEAFLSKFAPRADLVVTSAAQPNPVQANGQLTYTVTVANRGPDDTGDVVLTDTLPAGVTNVMATASAGSCSGTATITCNLGELAAGARATVTITATAPAAGPLRNAASVASNTPDAALANNAITQETRVATLPSIYGRVTLPDGRGLPGVTVNLSGGRTATTQTDSNGFYQFAELPAGGDYTLMVSRAGYVLPTGTIRELTTDRAVDIPAIACAFTLAPAQQSFPAGGGMGTISVTGLALCPWTAHSNADWITITEGASGRGDGTVRFTVAPTTVPRRGTLTIGDRVFTVQQAFEPCDAPSFRVARSFPLVSGTSDLVSGDFNGDGQPDLVALNVPAGAASLLLGDGRGDFGAPRRVELGLTTLTAARAAAVADFNRDGRDDLAVVGGGQNSTGPLFVLLGEAAGSLSAPRPINPSVRYLFVTVGNFNGDDRPDLLLVNGNNDGVIVLPGNGDGTFGAALISPAPSSPRVAASGDFNNDRNEDVALLGSSAIVVLLGDGMGRFATPRSLSADFATRWLTTGDFDRDGKLDIATTQSGSTNGLIALRRGDGTGAFAAARNFTVGFAPERIIAGDFNNDGVLDVVANDDVAGNVALLLGRAIGEFRAPVYFGVGTFYEGLAAADFNRDGNLDLAAPTINAANRTLPAQIALLLNTGAGFIAARDTILPQAPTTLAVGDFNGDGRQDVAVDQGETIAVRLSDTTGGFGAPVSINVSARTLEARDLNGDGRLDLLARGPERLTVLLGNSSGGFTASAPIAIGAAALAVVLEDFNRDGQPDLVALNAANQPALFLNNGVGGFAAPVGFGAGMNLNLFAAGDFNGDGHRDVLAATQVSCTGGTSAVIVFPGDGLGGFGPGVRSFINAAPQTLLTDDFNGDGRTDLVLANGCFGSGAIALALGSADGRLTAGPSYTLENGIGGLASGDINSDGRADLVFLVGDTFSSFSGLNVQALLGQAAGGFSQPLNIGTVTRGVGLAIGDINGDGRGDIVVANRNPSSGGTLSVLFNACGARPLAHTSAASFSGTQFAPESIVAAFGVNLATATQTATAPLPTQLAGTTVKVTDSAGVERAAPLFAVTPTQVNYQIPPGVALGTATITITAGDGQVTTGTIRITNVAPGLFAANANGQGVAAAVALRVRADGSQSFEPVARFDAALGRFVSVPIDLGPATDEVFLVAFGTGLRFRSALSAVSVRIGGVEVPVLFAGAQGALVGVDQVNVRLPRELTGRGEVDVLLTVDGQAANTVRINIQ